MRVWARNMMNNVDLSKEGIKILILATPISLHSKNFSIKLTLNKGLEFPKFLKHF